MALHRGVQSRNVLLSASLYAKLCDFGISQCKCSGNKPHSDGFSWYIIVDCTGIAAG
ncbi:hypothetical protein PC118_g22471 [Phytophthora cactorum]|uniref:Protein kinase domain-containing protein n=1 Tax=Phytophthora cactorum TaxID=29920 RepID=A0A8T1ES66_9STRA|nr:hypothetical protein PC111_g21840 [Phytophthora cactorum]KAG2960515.1 hypothetical protein PC118_g22471 [Phytophthora cactorum]